MVAEEKLGRNVDELMKQVGLRECVVILISTHAEGNVYGVPHRKRKRKIEDNNVCFVSDPCHFLFFFQLRYTNKGTRGGTQAIINGVRESQKYQNESIFIIFHASAFANQTKIKICILLLLL
ncbi:hypothetical protein V8G54_030237 [Vigna mungo]|uniref:Uncharacterized protein n=1 Tax=Vigna mungo TaxID=3915 RepID=A0AAQ3MVW5_VIGMU